jgi:hypothetical protein
VAAPGAASVSRWDGQGNDWFSAVLINVTIVQNDVLRVRASACARVRRGGRWRLAARRPDLASWLRVPART